MNVFLEVKLLSMLILTLKLKYAVTEENPINLNRPPRWWFACTASDVLLFRKFYPVDPTRKQEKAAYDRIVFRVNVADLDLEMWREQWASFTFNKKYDDYLSIWRTKYGEREYKLIFNKTDTFPTQGKIPVLDNESIEILPVLRNTLQKIAAVMEQVVFDAFVHPQPHTQSIYNSYINLNMVLCEVDTAMFQLAIPKFSDITRDFVEPQQKNIADLAARNDRDFEVINNLSNGLDYAQNAALFLEEVARKYYVKEDDDDNEDDDEPDF